MVYAAVALLVYVDVAHAYILIMCLLKAVQVERGIVAHGGLYDLRGKEVAVVGAMVAEEHFYFCSLLKHDEHAAVHHQPSTKGGGLECAGRLKYVDDLNGTVCLHVLGNIHQHAVLSQHGVEGCHRVVGGLGQLGIVFGYDILVLTQRTYDDTLRQWGLYGSLSAFHLKAPAMESVVNHEVEVCRQVGHVAAECLVWVDGYVEAVEVEAVVGGEERLHVGVLVALQSVSFTEGR